MKIKLISQHTFSSATKRNLKYQQETYKNKMGGIYGRRHRETIGKQRQTSLLDWMKCTRCCLKRNVLHKKCTTLGSNVRKFLKGEEATRELVSHQISVIFKNGNKSFARNYRPVSLTIVVYKIIEKMVSDNLVNTSQQIKYSHPNNMDF